MVTLTEKPPKSQSSTSPSPHRNESSDSSTTPMSEGGSSSRWSRPRWTARLGKILLAFGFYAGNLILNAVLLVTVHERVPKDSLPLPDVSFVVLPNWPAAIYLVESLIVLINLLVFVLVIFHRNGYRIGQRFCIINGIVYFMRAISISVTQLPVSGNRFNCEPKMSNLTSTWSFIVTILKRSMIYMPSLGIQMMAKGTYCGDNLYSGYIVNIVVGYSFLSYYLMPVEVKATSLLWWLADFLLYSSSIISAVLLLVARSHYLIDILFSYYVSSRVFYLYHTICNHESLHYSTPGNFFTKFWWWPLFVFFEVENPGRIAVVNRFYNPFELLKTAFSKKSNSDLGAVRSGETRKNSNNATQ